MSSYYGYDSGSDRRAARYGPYPNGPSSARYPCGPSANYSRDRYPQSNYGGPPARRAPPHPSCREYRPSGLRSSDGYGEMASDIEAYRSALRDLERRNRARNDSSYDEPLRRCVPSSSNAFAPHRPSRENKAGTGRVYSRGLEDYEAANSLMDLRRGSRDQESHDAANGLLGLRYGSRDRNSYQSSNPPRSGYPSPRSRDAPMTGYGRSSRGTSTTTDSWMYRTSSPEPSPSPLSLGPPARRASTLSSDYCDRPRLLPSDYDRSHRNSPSAFAYHRGAGGYYDPVRESQAYGRRDYR